MSLNEELSFQYADNNYDISVIMYPIAQKEINYGNYHQVYSCYLQNNNYNDGFTFELTYSLNNHMNPTYEDIADTIHLMLSDYLEYAHMSLAYYIISRYSTEDIKSIGMDELNREYITVMHQCNQIKKLFYDHNEHIEYICSDLYKIFNGDN